MKLEKALKSKALYYVALVLMVVNVLGYVSVGSVECIIVFAITYYLSNSYTKNQSLDILIGLFVANVIFGCGRVKEGFEEGAETLKKGAAKEHEKAKKKAVDAHNCPAGQHYDAKKKECVAAAKAHAAAAQKATHAAALAEAAAKKK